MSLIAISWREEHFYCGSWASFAAGVILGILLYVRQLGSHERKIDDCSMFVDKIYSGSFPSQCSLSAEMHGLNLWFMTCAIVNFGGASLAS